MLLASILLASTLGQVNPSPTRNDPPPCVVARVPGCREGYRLRHDAYGRPFYVFDPRSLPDSSPPSPAAQPPAYVVPPPAYPQPTYAPPPGYAPPPAYPPPPEQRLQFGLLWAPLGGASFSGLGSGDHTWHTGDRYAGLLAIALRGPIGGAQVRFSAEYGPAVRLGELSFKYNFNEPGMFRPFLSVGLGAARLDRDLGLDTGLRAELSASVGVDLFVTKDLFFTGELKGRGFSNKNDAASSSGIGQGAIFFGAGLFL